ncbi:MAG: sensor histidine kinase [Gammaproteobacteria bacterium]|nr:sensor histidine kinase [Gammaproteobacteria bacterium]
MTRIQAIATFLKQISLGINQLILLGAIVVGIGLSIVLLHWTESQYFQELDRLGAERLELYASTVQSAHKRFDYLPFIVSGDYQVKELLQNRGAGDEVNRKLEAWQGESSAAALYLMDKQGIVTASSNWKMPDSFVGNDYHFRPYFQDAIAGRQGQFFAVGVTTGRPGLFLSRPVMVGEDLMGAAVVKIDMTQLEEDWASGGENVLVADHDGIIFLASNPEWKYKSLEPLEEKTFARLKAEKKYSTNTITPLSKRGYSDSIQSKKVIFLSEESGTARTGKSEQRYLMHSRFIAGLDSTLYYLTSLKGLTENRRDAVFISTLIAILIALSGFILVNRMHNRQLLEKRVDSRTKALNEINSRLLDEINEHIKTEKQLHQTHEELIQAEKLAALGQMSAGLVHEINQPLSAMQTFVASTRLLLERDDRDSALENMKDIESMVRRMSTIVSHLKSFATKSKGHTTRVALNEVVDNALLLLRPRLAKSNVVLEWDRPKLPLHVKADEIKLEQIVINLIRNALDAMGEVDEVRRHQLVIELESLDRKINLYIKDTGNGINPDDLPKVFDPFFTTKEPGIGLGLGLSVSYGIASEFGGDLEAVNRADGGAVFKLTLDSAEASGEADDQ